MKSASKLIIIGSLSMVLLGSGEWTRAESIDSMADAMQLGRSLYRGTVAFSGPARLAQFVLPATSKVCSNCHGLRGEGKSEAGIEAPSLQWRRLTAARGALPAFTSEDAIAQAIVEGTGRHQQPLLSPMPQFVLSAEERSALLAYLHVIGTEMDPVPGVHTGSITIGSVLPLSGSRAEIGRSIQSALEARLDRVNRNGGIFGRQIELRVADAGKDAKTAMQAVQGLIDEGVFALLGSMIPVNHDELVALARKKSVPLVATLGLPVNDSSDSYLTYLFPSLVTQSKQLLNVMQHYCAPAVSGTLVLHTPEVRLRDVAQQVRAGANSGDIRLSVVEDEEQIRQALKAQPVGTVIGVLPSGLVASLREQWAGRMHAGQCLGTLAVLSGNPPDSTNVPASQTSTRRDRAEVIVLPMPPLAQSVNEPTLTEARLWQLLGDIAAQTFVEAVARAGYVLDTAGFIQALITLRAYETAPGINVTFSEKQHHGLNVAYLWRIDDHEPAKR